MTHLEQALIDSGIPMSCRYSLEEVARIMGCKLDHIRYLVNRDFLPALKVGKQTWGTVRHDDLSAFLDCLNGGSSRV